MAQKFHHLSHGRSPRLGLPLRQEQNVKHGERNIRWSQKDPIQRQNFARYTPQVRLTTLDWSWIYISYPLSFSRIVLRCFVFDLFKIKTESRIIASIYFNYVREIPNFRRTCLHPDVYEACPDYCSQATSKHQENVSPANQGKRWPCYKVQVSPLVTSRCKTSLNFCRNARRRWSRRAKWTAWTNSLSWTKVPQQLMFMCNTWLSCF